MCRLCTGAFAVALPCGPLNRRGDQLACFGRCEVEELVGAVLLRLSNLNGVLIDHLGDDAQPGGSAVQASSMFFNELPEATTVLPIRFARVVLAKDRYEITEEGVSAPHVIGVIPSLGHVPGSVKARLLNSKLSR